MLTGSTLSSAPNRIRINQKDEAMGAENHNTGGH